MGKKAFYFFTLFIVALIMALLSYFLIGLCKLDSIVIFAIALTAHPIVKYFYRKQ